MGYVTAVDNGTTIVITTTSEVITFTIATENAILMDNSNPLRAVVKDDVCWWYIYDLRLFAYQHTAGTPGSGMALTTDHGAGFPYVVSGDWDWYPLTAAEETAKAARLSQFQDMKISAPTSGGSRVFNGSTQYLDTTTIPVTDVPFTVSAWVKLDQLPTVAGDEMVAVGFGNNNFTRFINLRADDTSNQVQFNWNIGGTAAMSTTNTVTADTWEHYMGIAVADDDRRVILNGDWPNSGTSAVSKDPWGDLDRFDVGRLYFGAAAYDYLDGKIAHVAIWNVALTQDENKLLSEGADPLTIRSANLVAYWPLLDDDNDDIGSNHLSASGSPTWSTTDYPDVYIPTTGKTQNDWVIPYQIPTSGDGFTSDGTRRLEAASDVVKYTNDITRVGHADVIEMGYYTGDPDSPTDHLLEDIPADDNAASATVVATVGTNGNWETLENVNRNTSNDTVSTDIDQGTGLDTKGTYMIDHDVTAYDNAYFKQGTKIISFTPQFSYDDTADQTIWSLYVDAGDYIQITYDAINDKYELRVSWGGTLKTYASAAYTSAGQIQQLTTIQASWDSDKGLLRFIINGEFVAVGYNTGTPSASGAAYVFTGADCVTDADGTGQLPADIHIGNQIALDKMLIKGGAFFTGNGSVDSAVAHSDITAFIKGDESDSDALQIGTGNLTVVNATQTTDIYDNANSAFQFDADGEYLSIQDENLNLSNFSIGFWFKSLGDQASSTFFSCQAGYEQFSFYRDGIDNIFKLRYNGGTVDSSVLGVDPWDQDWYYILARFYHDGSDFNADYYVDGSFIESVSFTVAEETSYGTAIYIGADYTVDHANGIMHDITFTSDPGTPQISTFLGAGPIHAPMVQVD